MDRQIKALAVLALILTSLGNLAFTSQADEPAAKVPRSGSRAPLPLLSRILPRVAEEIRKEEARKEDAGKAPPQVNNPRDSQVNNPRDKRTKEPGEPKLLARKNQAATAKSAKDDAKPTPSLVAAKPNAPIAAANILAAPIIKLAPQQTAELELNPPAITRDPNIFSVLVSEKNPATSNWKALFNGKDLTSWQSSKFGGDGEIKVEDGAIILGVGGDMTGVTYTGEVPKVNYALEVEAQRRDGTDFFAGITFPVADSHVTLVPGGWGGGVFGISCINLNDASENETTKPKTFDDKKWYTFRIQVTESRIQVWVDGKEEIDLITTDKKLTTRGEVEASKPLGIATWRTEGAIRSIKLRSLTPQEILAAAPKK